MDLEKRRQERILSLQRAGRGLQESEPEFPPCLPPDILLSHCKAVLASPASVDKFYRAVAGGLKK